MSDVAIDSAAFFTSPVLCRGAERRNGMAAIKESSRSLSPRPLWLIDFFNLKSPKAKAILQGHRCRS
jgi:hypothetical protein